MQLSIAQRINGFPWKRIEKFLWKEGYAKIPRLLEREDTDALIGLYHQPTHFRKSVNMERHRFGVGDYQYFTEPLPPLVKQIRTQTYSHLVNIGRAWQKALGRPQHSIPETLPQFLELCAAHGQDRPTPLLLHYRENGYNCLHQDVYGPIAFPFQLVVGLGRPDIDYTGGEFVLVDQRVRQQARAITIVLEQGEGIIFATQTRPVQGKRGYVHAKVRHGTSTINSGERYTLGIIFHNAES